MNQNAEVASERAEAQQRDHERRRIAERNGGDERNVGAPAVRQRIADHGENRRAGNDEQDRGGGDECQPELDGHGSNLEREATRIAILRRGDAARPTRIVRAEVPADSGGSALALGSVLRHAATRA